MPLEFKTLGEWITLSDVQIDQYVEAGQLRGQRYLRLIENPHIREFAGCMWANAPTYFWVIPASSSGQHHWATYVGGLADHVFMGMHVASELAATYGLSPIERDCAIAAIAGHDCLKYGIDYDARYFDMHPFLPRSFYREITDMVPSETWETIMCAVERHMGNISDGGWTSVGRVRPETSVEIVVHLADYMSSRRDIRHTELSEVAANVL
jgi:hypothetical protein